MKVCAHLLSSHRYILRKDLTTNLFSFSIEDHHFDDASLDNVKGPRYGKRWGCCLETEVDAPPCKSGFHVTYDCDPQRWAAGIDFAKR